MPQRSDHRRPPGAMPFSTHTSHLPVVRQGEHPGVVRKGFIDSRGYRSSVRDRPQGESSVLSHAMPPRSGSLGSVHSDLFESDRLRLPAVPQASSSTQDVTRRYGGANIVQCSVASTGVCPTSYLATARCSRAHSASPVVRRLSAWRRLQPTIPLLSQHPAR